MKLTVLSNGQPSAVAFTVLAKLPGPKIYETEMGSVQFAKNCEGSTLTTQFHVHRRPASFTLLGFSTMKLDGKFMLVMTGDVFVKFRVSLLLLLLS